MAIDQKEEMEEVSLDRKEAKKAKKEAKLEAKFEEKIKELEASVSEWKNKYYSAYADCDNLRKSYEKDHQNILKYRAMGVIENLLPVFDSFHIALLVKPEDPKLQGYFKGFEMIYNQLVSALESEGIKEISPNIGDEFDHNSMQAIEVKKGEKEDNKVIQVYSKGYYLKDRLVRPAMVVVSKTETEDSDQDEKEEKTIN